MTRRNRPDKGSIAAAPDRVKGKVRTAPAEPIGSNPSDKSAPPAPVAPPAKRTTATGEGGTAADLPAPTAKGGPTIGKDLPAATAKGGTATGKADPTVVTDVPVIQKAAERLADGPAKRDPAADRARLAESISAINRLAFVKDLGAYEAIAEHVVDTYFDGDLTGVDRAKENLAFRELTDHPGLRVSYKTLTQCVRVLGQLRSLPKSVGEALTFSHHEALLPINDPELKLRLAQAAARDKLTVAALGAMIRKLSPPAATGRPPTPAFVKGLRAVSKGIGIARSEAVTAKAIDKLGKQAVLDLVRGVRKDLELLETLLARLEKDAQPAS